MSETLFAYTSPKGRHPEFVAARVADEGQVELIVRSKSRTHAAEGSMAAIALPLAELRGLAKTLVTHVARVHRAAQLPQAEGV